MLVSSKYDLKNLLDKKYLSRNNINEGKSRNKVQESNKINLPSSLLLLLAFNLNANINTNKIIITMKSTKL